MIQPSTNHLQKVVLENAKWMDKVLVSGVGIAGVIVLVIVLLKLTGAKEFEWANMKFSTTYAWPVCFILTVAHVYTAWLFIRSILTLWQQETSDNCRTAFQEVTTTGNLFVRKMIARTQRVRTRSGRYIVAMKIDDPSTWATYSAAGLLIAAIVPFDLTNIWLFLFLLAIATILTWVNWIVGSNWIIALSELTLEDEQAWYLPKWVEKKQKLYQI